MSDLMKRILCLHTADIHKATFGNLFKVLSPLAEITHVVKSEWLDEARRTGLTDSLRSTVGDFLGANAQQFDAVLCSCSTLGPIAEAAQTGDSNIIRIDSPLMRRAAGHDGTVIVAVCLESTLAPTLDLLEQAFSRIGKRGNLVSVMCTEAWPYFERGETELFADTIAGRVRQMAATIDLPGCIVLAQASMAVAEPLLIDLGVPVYASPRLAVEETLRVAASSRS